MRYLLEPIDDLLGFFWSKVLQVAAAHCERNSSVWASNVADCTQVEVSFETWLQPHESPTQDHGISQAMKRVKEKSGKHIRLKDVTFRSTLALHNPSF